MATSESAMAFYDHVWGSGGTQYPWWDQVNPYADGPNASAWPVRVLTDDREFSVSRSGIERACREIRDGAHGCSEQIVREAALLVSNPTEADVDAATADCILQVACFGEVVYG